MRYKGSGAQLSYEDREVFQAEWNRFFQDVRSRGFGNGHDFSTAFRIQESDQGFVVTDGRNIVGNVENSSRELMDALYRAAVQALNQ